MQETNYIAGNYSKSKNRFFFLLMAFSAYSLMAYFLNALGVKAQFSIILLGEGLLAIPLLVYGYTHFSNRFNSSTRRWCLFVLLYMVFEFFNSFLFTPAHDTYIKEIVFWLFFLSIFLLSSSKVYWSYLLKWSVGIVVLASVLSLYELLFNNYSYIRGEWDENSFLYNIQIGFAPFLLVLCYSLLVKDKRNIIITIIVFVFYIGLQFYFQKRLPLARCLLSIVLLLYVLGTNLKMSKFLPSVVLLLTIIIGGLVFIVPKQYVDATIGRFTQEGTVQQTTQDDIRYLILERAMDVTFSSPRTAIFGQGIGGVVLGDFYTKTVKDSNGNERPGLTQFEVGAAHITFKYGLVFFFVMFGYMLRLLLRVRYYKKDPLAMSCWLYLTIFFVMCFVGESFPNVFSVLTTVMTASSMGYLAYYGKGK